MADEDCKLTCEELDEMADEPLPERAAISLTAGSAAPINAAVALNASSDHPTAFAGAQQTAPIIQDG